MLDLLHKVMQPAAIYRGAAINHSNGLYAALGKTFNTMREAQATIDEAYRIIAKSIKTAAPRC